MMFLGFEISTDDALGKNIVIIASKKEKLVISFDPGIKGETAYYIKSAVDSRGHMVVVEHGELNGSTAKGRKP